MKTTAILPLLVPLLGTTTAQIAPPYMPVISIQKMNGNGCGSVNDFRLTFPDKVTMRVEYYGYSLNADPRVTDMSKQTSVCIPFLTLKFLERGWRLAIGDSTWTGYAKFNGGNKLVRWDTTLFWQFVYTYNWHDPNVGKKYYSNVASLGIQHPDFLPGETGDYDSEFNTTVKSPAERKWSPCFQGLEVSAEHHEIEFYSWASLEDKVNASGDAIFGRPPSTTKPTLVQEYKLHWEQCDPETIWAWGNTPMEKPADAWTADPA